MRSVSMPREILATFYDRVTYSRDKEGWRVPFNSERMKGFKGTADLIDADTGEVVLEAGKRLTARVRPPARREERHGPACQ